VKTRAAAGAVLLFGLAGGIALWTLREYPAVKGNDLLNRLTHFSLSGEATGQMRVLAWKSAWQGFRDRPFAGWGHNNVYYVLNRHYSPEQVRFNPDFTEYEVTWYDKSHNWFVDLAAEKGVLGCGLYLIVIGAICLGLWRMESRLLATCLGAGYLSCWVGNSVAFDSFSSLFVFYLFLPAIVLGARPGSPSGRSLPAVPSRVIAPVGAALIIAGVFISWETGNAVVRYREARDAFGRNPAAGWST